MYKKIVGIVVLTLLIATALPAVGIVNENTTLAEQQVSNPINTIGSKTTVTLYPTADATVVEGDPDTNYGTLGSIDIASYTEETKNKRSYLKFDLSDIPDSAIITQVTFRAFCWSALYADVGADIYGIESPWEELTITWNNQPFNPGSDPFLSYRMMTLDDLEKWCEWPETSDFIEYVQTFIPLDELGLMIKCNPESVSGQYRFDAKEWEGNTSELYVTYIDPPYPPMISGPTNGNVDTPYTYTFTSIDPDGDDIAEYTINWGDGPDEIITGPFPSGSSQSINHTWTSKGTYTIYAKAKDISGAESDWGEFEVTIPRTRTTNMVWFQWFLEHFPLLERLLSLLLL